MTPASTGAATFSVLVEVNRRFGVSAEEIRSGSRTRHILPARHVAVYLVHRATGAHPAEIGAQFGGRDHTSIMMYIRAVARKSVQDHAFGTLLNEMEQDIR